MRVTCIPFRLDIMSLYYSSSSTVTLKTSAKVLFVFSTMEELRLQTPLLNQKFPLSFSAVGIASRSFLMWFCHFHTFVEERRHEVSFFVLY